MAEGPNLRFPRQDISTPLNCTKCGQLILTGATGSHTPPNSIFTGALTQTLLEELTAFTRPSS